MMGDRKVETYKAYGKDCVRPVGKSWIGPAEDPVADTRLPVLTKDKQHIMPEEGEGLMGMRVGCTDAPGVTARDRLKCIGNGWDVIVTSMLLCHCKLSNETVESLLSSGLQQPTGVSSGLNQGPDESEAQQQLVQMLEVQGPEHTAAFIEGLPEGAAEQAVMLLVKHYVYQVSEEYSVVDSGSAKHLSRHTHVLNREDRSILTGFDGSNQWTEGNGYLPITITDVNTNNESPLDVEDVDLMSQDLISNILSLGKLLRKGFSFQLIDSKNCYATTPGGSHKIQLRLGLDDILRMPHGIRQGTAANRMPVLALRRSAGDGTYMFLHMVFNHSSAERIFRTLEATNGYKAVRLKPCHCQWCASDENATDEEGDLDRVEYTAEVAGRQLGVQSVPRFDLHNLRLWEVMFVDNKEYPCRVRGGARQALIFICCKSRLKMAVSITSKTHNGKAFSRMIAHNGIHKVEYPCRVYSDGCGSMVHVVDAAVKAGVDHAYVPPRQQSLNEEEKVVDRV